MRTLMSAMRKQVWAAIAHEAHLTRDVWLQAAPPDALDPTSTRDELGQQNGHRRHAEVRR